MAGDDDIKEHAINSSHDFYELLELAPTAGESEIRRAYRRTALKYHPDKVGASDVAAREKFDLLQIAYEILSDSTVRQLYDNARRAREEKRQREAAYDGRRRQLKDELERRERAGVAGVKRAREENEEEEAFQRELKRLAADGARRRKEREELLRREAQEEYEREQRERYGGIDESTPGSASTPAQNGSGVEEQDRTVKLRYPAEAGIDRDNLISTFGRFGKIEEAVLRNKRIKVEGEKHRREFTIAIIVYQSIVGAHAAVTDFPSLKRTDSSGSWSAFEEVDWLRGTEPDCIPKPKQQPTPNGTPSRERERYLHTDAATTPATPERPEKDSDPTLRKVPSFGSFKGTPKSALDRSAGVGSPSMEELTRIRLKNAERRRLAEKLRMEEEAETQEVQ